jgi:hypothetical protein
VLTLEPSPWADGVLDLDGIAATDDVEELGLLSGAAVATILVDPAGCAEPAALLEAAAATADRVVIRVTPEWPAKVRRLPAGNWAGLLAVGDGGRAARLLAATVPA